MKLIERNPARNIPIRKPEKSRIDLSHYILGSGQIGWLMPIGWYDIVPGDSLRLKTNLSMDYAPVLRPFMTRIDAYIHHHWVPFRLCMPRVGITNTDWESFIQGDPESQFNNDIVPHTTIADADIAAGCYELGSLNSYLGLPMIEAGETTNQTTEINLLAQIAYHLIYDEYYRNEWLQDRQCGPTTNWAITLQGGDYQGVGVGDAVMSAVREVFKEMDYFWGATPQAYKGSDSDVELDLDIVGDGSPGGRIAWTKAGDAVPGAGDTKFDGVDRYMQDFTGADLYVRNTTQGIVSTLEIMELRRTQALTRFLEAENRLGTDDYEDWLLSIFGVQNPDFRDKAPRYLGGGKLRTNVNSVVNPGDVLTPSTDAVNVPAGYQAGIAGIQGSTNTVSLNATEYGIVMTLMSVVPRTSYGNRIDRFFTKGVTGDRTEFYNPYFQNIGDQEIYEYEKGWALDADTTDVWAYQQRWAEYKYKPSYVTGDFVDTLDDFHMASVQDITAAGTVETFALNYAEVTWNSDYNLRIFQSQGSEHHLYYTVYNDAQFVRPMYLTDIPV